jgi:hypothetical protein
MADKTEKPSRLPEMYRTQKQYAKRQEALGHVRVTGWVPEGLRSEFLDFAETLRNR